MTRIFAMPPDSPANIDGGLIESFLEEQRDLTAVERFSQFHEAEGGPLQGRFYSSLLPGKTPGPGQQYAFEVDLDRCSGCKACVAACHSLNGLDHGEAWREVGLIIGGSPALPVIQHVTTACHHCLDPACLNACPVDAYEKDPVTGIVKHLDDQCFGCQYCTLACPYDAPKFHPGKGIVRKCDMCSDRLKVGEAPACVQACPHEAIRIRVVDNAEVVAVAEAGGFLPTAPDPSYTLPTTRYKTRHSLQGPVRAADQHREEAEHAHAPLVVMLVLTQAAVGALAVDLAGRSAGLHVPFLLPAIALGLAGVGINASLLHLGRPFYAYRAIIGFRHSWLSREVAAFGLFGAAAGAHALAAWMRPGWATATAAVAVASGLAAVFCSVMVYHAVRRPFWRFPTSGSKFLGTAVVLGVAVAFAVSGGAPRLAFGLALATLAKIGVDAMILNHLRSPRMTLERRTAMLLVGLLSRLTAARIVLGGIGGVALPMAIAAMGPALPPTARAALAAMACVLVFGGELAERALFFMAVVRPKMPGGLPS